MLSQVFSTNFMELLNPCRIRKHWKSLKNYNNCKANSKEKESIELDKNCFWRKFLLSRNSGRIKAKLKAHRCSRCASFKPKRNRSSQEELKSGLLMPWSSWILQWVNVRLKQRKLVKLQTLNSLNPCWKTIKILILKVDSVDLLIWTMKSLKDLPNSKSLLNNKPKSLLRRSSLLSNN